MTAHGGESFAHILGDIADNLKEIVRAEVRLASLELRDQATKVKQVAILVGVAGVLGVIGFSWFLFALISLLATVMTMWGAALVVSLSTLLIAGAVALAGSRRARQLVPALPKTKTTIREVTQWRKTHAS